MSENFSLLRVHLKLMSAQLALGSALRMITYDLDVHRRFESVVSRLVDLSIELASVSQDLVDQGEPTEGVQND